MSKNITTPLVAFVGGVLLGGVIIGVIFSSNVVRLYAPGSEVDIPFRSELLDNRLITSWSATVEGIVTSIDENKITIEGPDARVDLQIREGLTYFLESPEEGIGVIEPLPIADDVAIGSRVRGTFLIFPDVSDGFDGVAGAFSLVEKFSWE